MIIMMTRIATIWANPRLRFPSVLETGARDRIRKVNMSARAAELLARILVNGGSSGGKEI